MEVITPPQRVTPACLGGAAAPPGSSITAYKGIVSFTTASRQRGGRIPTSVDGAAASLSDSAVAGATLNGETAGLPLTSRLTCHYLLVRLEAQETDLLVFFNVPHEEFDKSGDPRGLSREEMVAEETVTAWVERMEIRNWGLFV